MRRRASTRKIKLKENPKNTELKPQLGAFGPSHNEFKVSPIQHNLLNSLLNVAGVYHAPSAFDPQAYKHTGIKERKKVLTNTSNLFCIFLTTAFTTAFIYFSQGSPISPLRTVINRSPVHPKNYKIQYNLKILKRKFTHYNIAKTSIKEVKISSWPRRKPN